MAEIRLQPRGLHRLYSRIYLAVLGIVAVLMLSFATAWHVHTDPRSPGQILGGLASRVERERPWELPPRKQQAVLEAWSARMNLGLTLYAADGRVLSSAGTADRSRIAPQASAPTDMNAGSFILSLPDGRRLSIEPLSAGQTVPAAKGTALVFAVIALIVGLGCYPLVRGLTRRLERLQRGVEAWDGSSHRFEPVRVGGRDEIAALATSFNRASERIWGLLRAQKSLLANASHELRSPLARLRLAIELLPAPAPVALTGELARNIAELDELVEEILLASRLDALGDAALHVARLDVAARVRAALGDTNVCIDGEPLLIEGDPRLIGRLLRNLLDNAHRYGGSAPVTASVRRDGDGVRVEVCDRGPGIAADERDRVFEPFYRAKGTTEHDGGVGLGLSLVKQIAHLHQGRVACQPREGGGSCFVVWLPERHPSGVHGGISAPVTSAAAPPLASATATPP